MCWGCRRDEALHFLEKMEEDIETKEEFIILAERYADKYYENLKEEE